MKYRYAVIDLFDGTVTGTDDEAQVREYDGSEEFFVIDLQECKWIVEGVPRDIPPLVSSGS